MGDENGHRGRRTSPGGDADFRTLYITATTSVYQLKTKTRGFVPYIAAKR